MPAMEINKVLLTIVMPVYNAEQYIEKALLNIAAQTFRNYELLVLDALSEDSTKAIIEVKQRTDPRITLVSESDNGIYEAMNKGIEKAKGEWIYFMGSDDDFFNADVLQNFSGSLNNENDIVYGDVLWVPDNIMESGECTPRFLLNRNINHQRIFYRKTLFKQWSNYNLQYKIASDHELNIRFFCNNSIRKQYIPLTVARYHSGGYSANKLDEVFWENWKPIFQKNFSLHLSLKEMYSKLGWYCRYQTEKHNYAKAFVLFWDVFLHTFSLGFVKLTFNHFIKSLRTGAALI